MAVTRHGLFTYPKSRRCARRSRLQASEMRPRRTWSPASCAVLTSPGQTIASGEYAEVTTSPPGSVSSTFTY